MKVQKDFKYRIIMEQEISKMNDLGKKLLDDMNLNKGSLCELEKNCFKTKSIDR